MSSLLREVIPLALAAAISPVIFLLQLNTLTGERPVARGAALTAGAAIVLIIVSTIGVLVGDTGFSTNDTLKAAINIGFGVLLVAVGLRALVRPPKPKAPTTDPKPPSIGGSFLAGAGGMASNLTTFALYTPALALIAGSGLALRQQGLAALTILLITLMVAWLPLLLAAVVPGASTRLLPPDRRFHLHVGRGAGLACLCAAAAATTPLRPRSGPRHRGAVGPVARPDLHRPRPHRPGSGTTGHEPDRGVGAVHLGLQQHRGSLLLVWLFHTASTITGYLLGELPTVTDEPVGVAAAVVVVPAAGLTDLSQSRPRQRLGATPVPQPHSRAASRR